MSNPVDHNTPSLAVRHNDKVDTTKQQISIQQDHQSNDKQKVTQPRYTVTISDQKTTTIHNQTHTDKSKQAVEPENIKQSSLQKRNGKNQANRSSKPQMANKSLKNGHSQQPETSTQIGNQLQNSKKQKLLSQTNRQHEFDQLKSGEIIDHKLAQVDSLSTELQDQNLNQTFISRRMMLGNGQRQPAANPSSIDTPQFFDSIHATNQNQVQVFAVKQPNLGTLNGNNQYQASSIVHEIRVSQNSKQMQFETPEIQQISHFQNVDYQDQNQINLPQISQQKLDFPASNTINSANLSPLHIRNNLNYGFSSPRYSHQIQNSNLSKNNLIFDQNQPSSPKLHSRMPGKSIKNAQDLYGRQKNSLNPLKNPQNLQSTSNSQHASCMHNLSTNLINSPLQKSPYEVLRNQRKQSHPHSVRQTQQISPLDLFPDTENNCNYHLPSSSNKPHQFHQHLNESEGLIKKYQLQLKQQKDFFANFGESLDLIGTSKTNHKKSDGIMISSPSHVTAATTTNNQYNMKNTLQLLSSSSQQSENVEKSQMVLGKSQVGKSRGRDFEKIQMGDHLSKQNASKTVPRYKQKRRSMGADEVIFPPEHQYTQMKLSAQQNLNFQPIKGIDDNSNLVALPQIVTSPKQMGNQTDQQLLIKTSTLNKNGIQQDYLHNSSSININQQTQIYQNPPQMLQTSSSNGQIQRQDCDEAREKTQFFTEQRQDVQKSESQAGGTQSISNANESSRILVDQNQVQKASKNDQQKRLRPQLPNYLKKEMFKKRQREMKGLKDGEKVQGSPKMPLSISLVQIKSKVETSPKKQSSHYYNQPTTNSKHHQALEKVPNYNQHGSSSKRLDSIMRGLPENQINQQQNSSVTGIQNQASSSVQVQSEDLNESGVEDLKDQEVQTQHETLTPVQIKEADQTISDQITKNVTKIESYDSNDNLKAVIYRDDIFELKKINIVEKKAQKAKDKQLMAQNQYRLSKKALKTIKQLQGENEHFEMDMQKTLLLAQIQGVQLNNSSSGLTNPHQMGIGGSIAQSKIDDVQSKENFFACYMQGMKRYLRSSKLFNKQAMVDIEKQLDQNNYSKRIDFKRVLVKAPKEQMIGYKLYENGVEVKVSDFSENSPQKLPQQTLGISQPLRELSEQTKLKEGICQTNLKRDKGESDQDADELSNHSNAGDRNIQEEQVQEVVEEQPVVVNVKKKNAGRSFLQALKVHRPGNLAINQENSSIIKELRGKYLPLYELTMNSKMEDINYSFIQAVEKHKKKHVAEVNRQRAIAQKIRLAKQRELDAEYERRRQEYELQKARQKIYRQNLKQEGIHKYRLSTIEQLNYDMDFFQQPAELDNQNPQFGSVNEFSQQHKNEQDQQSSQKEEQKEHSHHFSLNGPKEDIYFKIKVPKQVLPAYIADQQRLINLQGTHNSTNNTQQEYREQQMQQRNSNVIVNPAEIFRQKTQSKEVHQIQVPHMGNQISNHLEGQFNESLSTQFRLQTVSNQQIMGQSRPFNLNAENKAITPSNILVVKNSPQQNIQGSPTATTTSIGMGSQHKKVIQFHGKDIIQNARTVTTKGGMQKDLMATFKPANAIINPNFDKLPFNSVSFNDKIGSQDNTRSSPKDSTNNSQPVLDADLLNKISSKLPKQLSKQIKQQMKLNSFQMPVYEEIEDFEPISPKRMHDSSPRNTLGNNHRNNHLSELTSIKDQVEFDRKKQSPSQIGETSPRYRDNRKKQQSKMGYPSVKKAQTKIPQETPEISRSQLHVRQNDESSQMNGLVQGSHIDAKVKEVKKTKKVSPIIRQEEQKSVQKNSPTRKSEGQLYDQQELNDKISEELPENVTILKNQTANKTQVQMTVRVESSLTGNSRDFSPLPTYPVNSKLNQKNMVIETKDSANNSTANTGTEPS